MRMVVTFALSGCSLYFAPHHDPDPSTVEPDAAVFHGDTCPKPGTLAEITYPLDGATNVAVPVPIRMHVFIPNTLDGKGIGLTDANGQGVALDHWDASCSVGIPPIQTGPVQDETWTECYNSRTRCTRGTSGSRATTRAGRTSSRRRRSGPRRSYSAQPT